MMFKFRNANGGRRHRNLVIHLFLLSLLLAAVLQTAAKCPSKAKSFCLQVDGFDSILLDGSHFTDISDIFRRIGFLFESDHEAKEVDQLILINNHGLETLDRNVFCDFRFRRIVIQNCTRLGRVDRDAFNGTAPYVRSLTIDTVSLNADHTENFFEALNTLINLEELELKNHRVLQIREYAFRQKNLARLHLDGPLDLLANHAFFYCDNIRILKLTKIIRRIKQHAFHLHLASNKTLDIYLDAKVQTLERGIFLSTPRPLTINLYLKKVINLDAAKFGPVLLSPLKHELILHGNPKDMRSPCQLLWLFRNKHRFKGVFQFKDEPEINEAYFDKWQCPEESIAIIDETMMVAAATNVHENMNGIDHAAAAGANGVSDDSHNGQSSSLNANNNILPITLSMAIPLMLLVII